MRPWPSCKKFGTSRPRRTPIKNGTGGRRGKPKCRPGHPHCEKRRPMDENLIGYLLDALDSDTRQETERYLLKNPEARAQLEKLEQALEPLEADREADEPPPDLWV